MGVKDLCQHIARRFKFFFKDKYWTVVGLVGVVIELAAVVLAHWHPAHPLWAGVLGGIGGSIIATVIVSFGGPSGEEVYQNFIRLGIEDFYPSRSDVPNDTWVRWLKEARVRCVLLGQAHGEWCTDPGFERALIERLNAGVRVEMFFLSPTGNGIKTRKTEDSHGTRNTEDRIRRSIKFVWAIRLQLQGEPRSRLALYVYDATPSVGVTWIDNSMLITHYLAGSVNLTSPALRVEPRPGSKSVYSVYEDNVNTIRNTFSSRLTEENIASFIGE